MSCTLCGLDCGSDQFCCPGCANVHAILLESGVIASGVDFRQTELFQQSLRMGLISRGAAEQPAIPEGAETREALFHVTGMWCTSCGWLIEHALTRARGVRSAEVLFASDLLKVRYCPRYLPPERIAECVAALGYRAAEYNGPAGTAEAADAERKDLLLRTGIAAFLSMNAMLFSLVVYASYFERITGFGRYIPFVLMALATPSVFYCGAPILRLAWAGVRLRVLRMESLLAMGILMAYGYSAVLAFRGSTRVYFDTACAIVTLVLAGKMIERGAKERTARAIALLYRLMPNKVRVAVEGGERFVSLEALRPGALFRVKSGERIPADGVVVEGRSHADEAVLTGESAPRRKQPGDAVVCGSVNIGGLLEVRATRVGADSTLAQIVRTVEQAGASRTRVERAVDRTARLFVPAVLALAALTFTGWQWRTGSPAEALLHAIAVLVIACPCALGIATPLALTAAVAAASRRGVLVSDTRVLETIRAVDVVVLDKTGTATAGQFSLLAVTGDASRMAALSALEACSEHPLAKAVTQAHAAGARALDPHIHPGMGLTGVVDGTEYVVGNRALFASLGMEVADSSARDTTARVTPGDSYARRPDAGAPAPQDDTHPARTATPLIVDRIHPDVADLNAHPARTAPPLIVDPSHPDADDDADLDAHPPRTGTPRVVDPIHADAASTIAYFGWDGAVKGTLRFGDRIRPDAVVLCGQLRQRGIRTLLLSGDAPAATEATATAIGADAWIAEATPSRKAALIAEMQQRGDVVAMIGDGVNDAPSLARADLGIALGCGADIAMQAAPLVLMGSLNGVLETLDLARRCFRIVRQNLFWAFAYNVVGMALAVTGVLNPILAAAAMVLSSLSVIGNSRRLG